MLLPFRWGLPLGALLLLLFLFQLHFDLGDITWFRWLAGAVATSLFSLRVTLRLTEPSRSFMQQWVSALPLLISASFSYAIGVVIVGEVQLIPGLDSQTNSLQIAFIEFINTLTTSVVFLSLMCLTFLKKPAP